MDHVLAGLSARAVVALPATTVDNPFDHTTPNLEVFGVDFSNRLYALLGGLWGIAFVYGAARLVLAFVRFMSARRVQHNPDAVSDASRDAQVVAVGLILLSAVGAIFVVLVNLFS
ncbi:hypothetical protein D5R93_02315 [Actinomyces lilanjuaniae]|uniref:DUF202 domain-containing protein n=1 Tax=Actinomyces lilanjuaniae TaxID=2321394 RepID=A0ABN5PQS0_9ACTO|nr:hypothetical protein [Actinomyces lilanjuaniae]AYD89182.1 hypothetical protein D5R93_02315 [Actinomyces lilanjuaniae]